MEDAPYNLDPEVEAEISDALRWLRSAGSLEPEDGQGIPPEHAAEIFGWIERAMDALEALLPPSPALESE